MTRRAVVPGAITLATLVLGMSTPFVLRLVPFFQLRQVELVGVQYRSPDLLLAGLGLADDHNLFDSAREVRQRVLRIPGITSARVERRLPATLRITVEERAPVAFVSGPEGLVALDAKAHPLPYDPVRAALDLPIVERADTLLTGTLSVVSAVDPDLFGAIDGVRRAGGAVVMMVGERRMLFDGVPSTGAVERVGAVRRHLTESGRDYRELDVRFDGWVVVRGVTG